MKKLIIGIMFVLLLFAVTSFSAEQIVNSQKVIFYNHSGSTITLLIFNVLKEEKYKTVLDARKILVNPRQTRKFILNYGKYTIIAFDNISKKYVQPVSITADSSKTIHIEYVIGEYKLPILQEKKNK